MPPKGRPRRQATVSPSPAGPGGCGSDGGAGAPGGVVGLQVTTPEGDVLLVTPGRGGGSRRRAHHHHHACSGLLRCDLPVDTSDEDPTHDSDASDTGSLATSEIVSRSSGWVGSSARTSELGDADHDHDALAFNRPAHPDAFLAWHNAYAYDRNGDGGVYFYGARDPATDTVACNMAGCTKTMGLTGGSRAVLRRLYAHWATRHSPAARARAARCFEVEAKVRGARGIEDVKEWIKEIAVRPKEKEPGYPEAPQPDSATQATAPAQTLRDACKQTVDSDVWFFSHPTQDGKSMCLHGNCGRVLAWKKNGLGGLAPLQRHWERYHAGKTARSQARTAAAQRERDAFAAAETLEDITEWFPKRAVAPARGASVDATTAANGTSAAAATGGAVARQELFYFDAPDADGYLKCLHPGCSVRLFGADRSNLKKHWVRRHSPAALPARTKRVRTATGLSAAEKKAEIASATRPEDFTEWHPSRAYQAEGGGFGVGVAADDSQTPPAPRPGGAYFFGPLQPDGTVTCNFADCGRSLLLGHLSNLERHWIRMHLLRPAGAPSPSEGGGDGRGPPAGVFTPLPLATLLVPPAAAHAEDAEVQEGNVAHTASALVPPAFTPFPAVSERANAEATASVVADAGVSVAAEVDHHNVEMKETEVETEIEAPAVIAGHASPAFTPFPAGAAATDAPVAGPSAGGGVQAATPLADSDRCGGGMKNPEAKTITGMTNAVDTPPPPPFTPLPTTDGPANPSDVAAPPLQVLPAGVRIRDPVMKDTPISTGGIDSPPAFTPFPAATAGDGGGAGPLQAQHNEVMARAVPAPSPTHTPPRKAVGRKRVLKKVVVKGAGKKKGREGRVKSAKPASDGASHITGAAVGNGTEVAPPVSASGVPWTAAAPAVVVSAPPSLLAKFGGGRRTRKELARSATTAADVPPVAMRHPVQAEAVPTTDAAALVVTADGDAVRAAQEPEPSILQGAPPAKPRARKRAAACAPTPPEPLPGAKRRKVVGGTAGDDAAVAVTPRSLDGVPPAPHGSRVFDSGHAASTTATRAKRGRARNVGRAGANGAEHRAMALAPTPPAPEPFAVDLTDVPHARPADGSGDCAIAAPAPTQASQEPEAAAAASSLAVAVTARVEPTRMRCRKDRNVATQQAAAAAALTAHASDAAVPNGKLTSADPSVPAPEVSVDMATLGSDPTPVVGADADVSTSMVAPPDLIGTLARTPSAEETAEFHRSISEYDVFYWLSQAGSDGGGAGDTG